MRDIPLERWAEERERRRIRDKAEETNPIKHTLESSYGVKIQTKHTIPRQRIRGKEKRKKKLTGIDDMDIPLDRTLDNPTKDIDIIPRVHKTGCMRKPWERVGRHHHP